MLFLNITERINFIYRSGFSDEKFCSLNPLEKSASFNYSMGVPVKIILGLRRLDSKHIIRFDFQQSKGGDPVSHCLIARSGAARIWIVASDGVCFA